MPATRTPLPAASRAAIADAAWEKKAAAASARASVDRFNVEPIIAFYCFLAPALLAAVFSPILDCDETFNYWEPTHYLRYGFGLQTWEYSPEYAIRSWLYISIHAITGRLLAFLPFVSKIREFYLLRVSLAVACAVCETHLFRTICRTFNPRVGIMFMLCMVFSPGMFHASVAYLPSSFAMCAVMLGMAAFLNWRGGLKTAEGIMWFGTAGIVGWPFAIALSAPFLVEEGLLALVGEGAIFMTAWRMLDGVVRSFLVLSLGFVTDLFFYHRIAVVPFNIVWYNIFSGSGKGPDIFGTEPWHFYLKNLSLNFNIWFLLALLAMPLLALQFMLGSSGTSLQTRLRGLVFVSPFYLWLGIFTLQPHKEERFIYPAYPALALNAAMALHIILVAVGSTKPGNLAAKVSGKVKFVAVSTLLLASIGLGALRTLGVVTAYAAPLQIHQPLQDPSYGGPGGIVCYGKEWYRFPSSYFLPSNMRAKFIKSEFDGLLPGEFSEARIGFGIWPTFLVPPGMNDANEEDMGKYIDVAHCPLLVDSYYPGSPSSELQPHHVLDNETWERVSCHRMLDASRTHLIGRTLWLPDLDLIPAKYRRSWGQMCLLRRKTSGV
ncbi:MAG: mannosyltransferase [Thelocarpon superellum]|nr:MAG: mannosyltransferase [Thelocarpon superellum]